MLKREGVVANHKRIYRLYKLERLAVRTKKRKRIAARARTVLAAPMRPNERWSMDFVSDVTWSGRRFRIFAVVDDFTRETLALVVDTSIGGARVARVLEELVALRGAPVMIVCDNGPEFTSKALDAWAYQRGVKLHFIRPGKPVENAYVESFNGKLRNECLNENWFLDLRDARRIIEAWRVDYNEVRPHSSLDGMTPKEY
jgi:putative transposase